MARLRVGLISDTHGDLPDPHFFSGLDYLIHAGDIGPDYQVRMWIQQTFKPWITQLKDLGVIPLLTFGNHDDPEKWQWYDRPQYSAIYVDDFALIGRKKVWFSPWSPTFGSWSWMRPEQRLKLYYDSIPEDVDILVSHTPPYGTCDRMASGDPVGSLSLAEWLDKRKDPTVVICGHIHEGRGDIRTRRGNRIINCSVKNEMYESVHDPREFILEV